MHITAAPTIDLTDDDPTAGLTVDRVAEALALVPELPETDTEHAERILSAIAADTLAAI